MSLNWIWAENVGKSSDEFVTTPNTSNYITIDTNDNVYITGLFGITITLSTLSGPVTLTLDPNISYTAYFAKLDSDGNFLWANQTVSTTTEATSFGNCIAINSNNEANVYAIGNFTKTIVIGANTYTNINDSLDLIFLPSTFIVKLDANTGTFINSTVFLSTSTLDNNVTGTGIYINALDEVYVTGGFLNTITFGTILVTSDISSVYVALLDSNLIVNSVIHNIGTNSSIGYKVFGNNTATHVYVVGGYKGTVTLGSTELSTLNNNSLFVARVDNSASTLSWKWAVSTTDGEYDNNASIISYPPNLIYISGYYQTGSTSSGPSTNNNHTAFIRLFIDNNITGLVANNKYVSVGTNSIKSTPTDIKITGDGKYVVNSGVFFNTTTFFDVPTVLQNSALISTYIATLDTTSFLWNNAVNPVGTVISNGNSIAISPNSPFSGIYLTGNIGGTAIGINLQFGLHNITFGTTGYVAKLYFVPIIGNLHISINTDNAVATIFADPVFSYACSAFPPTDSHAGNPPFSLLTFGVPLFTFELTSFTPIIYNPPANVTPQNTLNVYTFTGPLINSCIDQVGLDIDRQITGVVLNFFNTSTNSNIYWSTITLDVGSLTNFPILTNYATTVTCGGYISMQPVTGLTLAQFASEITNGLHVSFDTTSTLSFGTDIFFGASKSTTICCILPGATVNTTNGSILIENLKKNDIVLNSNNKRSLIVQNAKITVNRQYRYVTIHKDMLGENMPNDNISIAFDHPILYNGQETKVQDLIPLNLATEHYEYVETFYLPITNKREYIIVNNISVCTFEYSDFNKLINILKNNGCPLDYTYQ